MDNTRLAKLKLIQSRGVSPYPSVSLDYVSAAKLQERFALLENDKQTDEVVIAVGRVMAIRNSGMFLVLKDEGTTIQIYNTKDSAEATLFLETLDIGDIIAVKGQVRRTKRGELTIDSQRLDMLCKTLRPMPEKYHGLKDTDQRYRQRYLDILSNEESAQRFQARSRLVAQVRRTLSDRGFTEVETPMLQPIYGGAVAQPFKTSHNALGIPLYLRIAPELYLKQVLVSGLANRVFEVNRNFRNEGISTRHNPEFTMLEAYQAYADMADMMELTEAVFYEAALAVRGTAQVSYANRVLEFTPPFARRSMNDLVWDHVGANFLAVETDDAARALAREAGVHVDDDCTWGECLAATFEEKVESLLIQPTHVTELPADISPLSKRCSNPRLAERFETYVNGWEIANAFSELNDPVLQREIMQTQIVQAHNRGEFESVLDEDFLCALEHGMPPAGGLGVGIDRLCMVLTNAPSIRDVILFPTRRPEKQDER